MAAPDLAELKKRLKKTLPDPKPELDYETPWQLLVATILSAQSTDQRVNQTTPALFQRFGTPAELAESDPTEVEALIKSTGFFRNKTKSIRNMSRALVERHGGEVPRTMDEMVKLPGVARKTANLVLGEAHDEATGIVVDTHAARVARRLGLTDHDKAKAEAIERDLMAAFDRRSWVKTGHRLVLHGRYVCRAKKPRCAACPLNEVCPSREAEPEGGWTKRADAERRHIESRGEAPLEV